MGGEKTKKEYVKPKHPTELEEHYKPIMSKYWKAYDKARQIIFEWLNKTDAPKEVWDACDFWKAWTDKV